MVDFVGELGPISKWRLVGLDIILLCLQAFMLIVGHEKRKLGDNKSKKVSTPAQDIEAEEAGVRRSQEDDRAASEEGTRQSQEDNQPLSENEDGIELQSLNSTAAKTTSTNEEDVIITINIKNSLKELATQSSQERAEGSRLSSAERINSLVARLQASRALPGN